MQSITLNGSVFEIKIIIVALKTSDILWSLCFNCGWLFADGDVSLRFEWFEDNSIVNYKCNVNHRYLSRKFEWILLKLEKFIT
jgi:hypothetical protein